MPRFEKIETLLKNTLEEILMDVRHGRSLQSVFIYADDEPKSALARDLGDCRDNKGKLVKRFFTCFLTHVLNFCEHSFFSRDGMLE